VGDRLERAHWAGLLGYAFVNSALEMDFWRISKRETFNGPVTPREGIVTLSAKGAIVRTGIVMLSVNESIPIFVIRPPDRRRHLV
jgi:hypothetical protein